MKKVSSRLVPSAVSTAIGISRTNLPKIPLMKSIGMKAIEVDSTEAVTGATIWAVPATAASSGSMPSSTSLTAFSVTTIESSTRIPLTMMRPIIEMRLMLKPHQ
jgi:hypothetical protein